LIPIDLEEYREPMVGGGSVFFAVRGAGLARRHWVNDLDSELVAFWQTVQDRARCNRLRGDLYRLRAKLREAEHGKGYFQQSKQPGHADEPRRALLFFFFNRVTFSGTTQAGGFSRHAFRERFTLSSIRRLAPMPEALKQVRITDVDFEGVVRTPGKNVFLFLDPPYFTTKRLYGRGGRLHDFDHGRLARVLRRTKHRFLLTYDDCPEVRELYEWAEIRPWRLQYGMSNCNRSRASRVGAELFIANYSLPEVDG